MLYIGIDAGGSKTELLAAPAPDAPSRTFHGPAANPQRLGLSTTARVLADLVQRSMQDDEPVAICAGVAGAGRDSDQQAIREEVLNLLGMQARVAAFEVTHDAEIALEGAFGGESGVIVIAGTGSVSLGRTAEGETVRSGGWGYLIGDEGSGNSIGIRGLRAVAADIDGGPQTVLRSMLADRHGIDDGETLIRRVYREGWAVQTMAPLVIEAAMGGDAVAERILRKQANALAKQVSWLGTRAPGLTPRIALIGGLTNGPLYRALLTEALQERLPGWEVTSPAHSPAYGAMLRAWKRAQAT